MMTPEEFLESNGLATRTIDRAALVAAFQKEMEAGLAGEPSSLKMIPTFTSPYGDVAKDTPVTVLEQEGGLAPQLLREFTEKHSLNKDA